MHQRRVISIQARPKRIDTSLITTHRPFLITDIIIPRALVILELILRGTRDAPLGIVYTSPDAILINVPEEEGLELLQPPGRYRSGYVHDLPIDLVVGAGRLGEGAGVAPEMNRFLDVGMEWMPFEGEAAVTTF